MINILSKIKLIYKQNRKHNLLCICVDFKSELFIYLFIFSEFCQTFIYLFIYFLRMSYFWIYLWK